MPYLGVHSDVPGANIKSYRYKQGTDTSSGATSFPAVNKGADELRVYLNGALLKLTDDYTFTTSAVTIDPAPADDDEIQIDVYTSMNIADTVSASDGGTFINPVVFQNGVKTGAVKAQDGTSAINIADSTGKVTIPGDLEIQGTTTTIDTNVESVDKLEVGANSGDHAVSVSQSGAGAGIKVNQTGTGNLLQLQDSGTDKFVVKDGGNVEATGIIKTDDIQEKTSAHGVEIDGVLVKDGDVGVTTISSKAGTSVGVTLGTDAGDDFNVGSGKLVVKGDSGVVQKNDSYFELRDGSTTYGYIGKGSDLVTGKNAQDLSLRYGLTSGTNTREFHIAEQASPRLTLGVGGDATLHNGSLIIGTAGKGINFHPQGGSNVNLLDDYEEGTFSVSFTCNSGTASHTFSYVKVGNQVTVAGKVSQFCGANGPFTITTSTTLPFTPKSNTSAILYSTMNRVIDSATDGIQLITNTNDATLHLVRVTSASASASEASGMNSVQKTNISTTTFMSTFAGTYITS